MAAPRRFRGAGDCWGRGHGFSTLELIIVLTIVLVIAGVATPNILGTIQRYRLRSGADQVMTDLREIQSMAMSSGGRYRLIVTNCTSGPSPCKRYRTERQAAGGWPATSSGSGGDVLSEWVDLQNVSSGIRLSSMVNSSGGADVDSVVFDPRGASVTAASPYSPINVTITVTHTSGQVRRVLVRSAGSVRMQ